MKRKRGATEDLLRHTKQSRASSQCCDRIMLECMSHPGAAPSPRRSSKFFSQWIEIFRWQNVFDDGESLFVNIFEPRHVFLCRYVGI